MRLFVCIFLIINVCNSTEVNYDMTGTNNFQPLIEYFSIISGLESTSQNASIVYFIILMTTCLFGCSCGVLCLCLCTFLCIAFKKMKPKKSHKIQKIYCNTETVNKDIPASKTSDIYSYAIPWNFLRFKSLHGRKNTIKNNRDSIPAYAVRHSDMRKELDLTYAYRTSEMTQTV